jgi:hypothetical protein
LSVSPGVANIGIESNDISATMHWCWFRIADWEIGCAAVKGPSGDPADGGANGNWSADWSMSSQALGGSLKSTSARVYPA